MNNKPERTFRLGTVSASVFKNTAKESQREFRTLTPQKSYQSGDKREFNSSFTVADLPAAVAVMVIGFIYLVMKEVWSA